MAISSISSIYRLRPVAAEGSAAATASSSPAHGLPAEDLPRPVAPDQVQAAYGHVTTVRHIGSRGVTRIEIEIPCESHIAATSAFFEKDVLLLPLSGHLPGQTRYGVLTVGLDANDLAAAFAETPAAADLHADGRTFGSEHVAAPDLGHRASNRLAMLCQEERFQRYLGATDELSCAELVRRRLGTHTRAMVDSNHEARAAMEVMLAGYHRCG